MASSRLISPLIKVVTLFSVTFALIIVSSGNFHFTEATSYLSAVQQLNSNLQQENQFTAQSLSLPSIGQQQQAPVITPFSFPSVLENKRISVLCTITSGDLPVQISWLKDNQPLTQRGQIIIKPDSDQSTLKFTQVKLEHAGNYTCVARNKAGLTSYSAQLVVLGEPRWLRGVPNHEPIVATRGQTIVIDCQTTGWPKPQQSWQIKTHAQSEFEPLAATGRISLAANGSLVIRNADKSDEANYLCKSHNGIGKDISWSTSLKVNVPAHFEPSKQSTQQSRPMITNRQQSVQLRCDASGDEPISIEWFKNKQRLSNELEPRYSINNKPMPNGLISVLNVRQAQRQDNSVFECVARNLVGKDRFPIELIVQEEPDNIQELQVTLINSRSVTLMWSEPYDGRSPITNYMFQYKKLQQLDSSAASLLGDYELPDSTGQMRGLSDGSALAPPAAGNYQRASAGLNSMLLHQASSSSADDWQQASRIMLPVQPQNSNSSFGTRSITIDKLDPSTKYVLRALAINAIGQSKFSQPMEFSTEEEAPETGPANIRAVAINSTSVQVSWDEIPRSRHLGRIHGYYIGYRVANPAPFSATQNHTTAQQNFVYIPYVINDLISGQAQGSVEQRLETLLQDLRRDTLYEITVVAFNSRGSGPSSDSVLCKTIEMEAPKPVKIQIRRASNESIFIEWQRDPSDQNPVDDYSLFQEKSQEWVQMRLPGNQSQYKASGLKCGSRYQFYMTAQNKVGKSASSEMVSASTSGSLPGIPSKTNLIKMVNSTCLLVNLYSFQDNGCRINSFTVRYRAEKQQQQMSNQPPSGSSSGVSSTSGPLLVGPNGLAASQQALASSLPLNPSGQQPAMNIPSKASQAAAAVAQQQSLGAAGISDWIAVRPRSNARQSRANEEDRMEYLCGLSPTGEYTIHVSASNDVGRSEIEYTVLMSSDELRQSALRDLIEFFHQLPNVFAYIPSILVFLLAGLFLGLVSLILYTTAIKYYQKFVIMHNQLRATRRAKRDERRRRKLNNARHNQKLADLWADEYEEDEEDENEEDEEEMEEEEEIDCGNENEDDGDDEAAASDGNCTSSSSSRSGSGNRRDGRQLMRPPRRSHSSKLAPVNHQFLSPAQANCHYLTSNLAQSSAFDSSSIDSMCNTNKQRGSAKFMGSTCGNSTGSSDSLQAGGRFQCLNATQYVKMNEYTMLPSVSAAMAAAGGQQQQQQSQVTQPAAEIYGVIGGQQQATAANSNNQQQPQTNNSQKSSSNNNSQLYYSTLRRSTMQTYLPARQPQQAPPQSRRPPQHSPHSQLMQAAAVQMSPSRQQQHNSIHRQRRSQQNVVSDIYGYYMAPQTQQAQTQNANGNATNSQTSHQSHAQAQEAAHSIFVPPQQIIYSAPNIRRQPVFL